MTDKTADHWKFNIFNSTNLSSYRLIHAALSLRARGSVNDVTAAMAQ